MIIQGGVPLESVQLVVEPSPPVEEGHDEDAVVVTYFSSF
jgi:hypothetical protein